MAFLVSPGVHVREIDLTNVIPAVSTSIGAIAGPFQKGPVSEVVNISSEEELITTFGKPNSSNFEWWFTAANFLQYGDALKVVRAESGLTNAASAGNDALVSVTVATASAGSTSFPTASISAGGDFDTQAVLGAVTAGVFSVAVAAGGSGYSVNDTVTLNLGTGTEATLTVSAVSSGAATGLTIATAGAYTAMDSDVLAVATVGGNADLTVNVTFSVTSVAVTTAGDGYGSAPTITLAGTSLTQTATANMGTGFIIRGDEHYESSFAAGQASGKGSWAARSAGKWANGLSVSMCSSADAYSETSTSLVDDASADAGDTTITVDNGGEYVVGDILHFQEADGSEYEISAIASNLLTIRLKDDPLSAGLQSAIADNTAIRRRWRFYDLFDAAPGTSTWCSDRNITEDEVHIVVFDQNGLITGYDNDVAGNRTTSVVETFANLSKHPDCLSPQGGGIYYPDVIFRSSAFIYWLDHPSSATNWGNVLPSNAAFFKGVNAFTEAMGGGTDDYAVTTGELALAYDRFGDPETLDINLILGGPGGGSGDSASLMDTHVTMITDLVEKRRDCVGFVSPYRSATVGVTSIITQTSNVVAGFDACPSSSYMVFDSGYKYMYDKYNDVYRYVPFNGDTAGLCAFTDNVADPWFSPAGYNRGNVRGAIKLAFNPMKAHRDQLYRARINPVCDFPGQGVVLFGDKTALSKPSAFDRINVRRLFLVLEKAIATAAKYMLFEFNDEFTRAQFRNMVEPFLRDVQGRRGITDFVVKCDATNNTGEVIDRNEFIGDIFIKPARSINFITLNFIAVRTGVAFSEVGG